MHMYIYNGDNGVQTKKFSSRQRQLHAHTRTHIYVENLINTKQRRQATRSAARATTMRAYVHTHLYIHAHTHRCMHARLEACKAMGGDRQARTSTAATTTTKTRTRRTGRHQVNSSKKLEQVRKRERTMCVR